MMCMSSSAVTAAAPKVPEKQKNSARFEENDVSYVLEYVEYIDGNCCFKLYKEDQPIFTSHVDRDQKTSSNTAHSDKNRAFASISYDFGW